MQVIQKFVLETDLNELEVEYSSVARPAGALPLYLKVRH